MKGIKATKNLMKNIARLYVKKPLAIRAMQINQTFWVETLEGNHQGKEGDYFLEGIRGELYICDREIFEESYTLLNPSKELGFPRVVEKTIGFLDDLRAVVNITRGVDGWHLNGDLASWEELGITIDRIDEINHKLCNLIQPKEGEER